MASHTAPTHDDKSPLEEKGKGIVNLETELDPFIVVTLESLPDYIAMYDKFLKEKEERNVNLKRERKGKKPSPVALASRRSKSLKDKGKGNVNLKRKLKAKKPSPVALASRIASRRKSLKEEGKGNVKPRMSVSYHVARDNPYPFHSRKCPCTINTGGAPLKSPLGLFDQVSRIFPASEVEMMVERFKSLAKASSTTHQVLTSTPLHG